jgi:TonB family protein
MHQSLTHRASRRRGAPLPPKRRRSERPPRFASTTGGFEGLIPDDGSEDLFFSSWLREPGAAAEFLEHGGVEPLETDPRVGVVVSGALHILIVLFLLLEPTLGLLGAKAEPTDVTAEMEKREPLVLFMEEPPPPEPPAVAEAPLVPVVPDAAPPTPQEQPPAVADNRLVIPKALLAPPEDKVQEFMNDLPFSEGNTEEFYTDEEVKDPGKEGETESPEPPEDTKLSPESGEDETTTEKTEGSETGNDGTKVAELRPTPGDVGSLLFGDPLDRDATRARSNLPPPKPRPETQLPGEGGENGAFTDIRRFLAGARFDNPEGGLVANTNNTLYYNDKGANFVPWLSRMIAEVRRNWIVPYSITFTHGHVAIGISVARNGTVTAMNVLYPSGTSGFDNAAVGAIRAARLLPLPSDYPDDQFDIILVFWYNERPYDIFG